MPLAGFHWKRQAEIFQEDEVVAMHLKSMGAGGEVAAKDWRTGSCKEDRGFLALEPRPGQAPVLARGDHFAMLHEPHVAALAMRSLPWLWCIALRLVVRLSFSPKLSLAQALPCDSGGLCGAGLAQRSGGTAFRSWLEEDAEDLTS